MRSLATTQPGPYRAPPRTLPLPRGVAVSLAGSGPDEQIEVDIFVPEYRIAVFAIAAGAAAGTIRVLSALLLGQTVSLIDSLIFGSAFFVVALFGRMLSRTHWVLSKHHIELDGRRHKVHRRVDFVRVRARRRLGLGACVELEQPGGTRRRIAAGLSEPQAEYVASLLRTAWFTDASLTSLGNQRDV